MSVAEQRIERIRASLEEALAPQHLDIIDESHKHAGHASAKGGGHYIVEVVSPAFEGKGLVARHRLVYAALQEMMAANEVHAVSIKAHTPDEFTS